MSDDDEWEEFSKLGRKTPTSQPQAKKATPVQAAKQAAPIKANVRKGSGDSWDWDAQPKQESTATGFTSGSNLGDLKPAGKALGMADFDVKLGPGSTFRVKGMTRKECPSMLCTDCGIRVSKFEGYQWNEDKTNYLFFRANFGDFERLKEALIKTDGASAYACGCKGYSVEEGCPVPDGYKWKCTGCEL